MARLIPLVALPLLLLPAMAGCLEALRPDAGVAPTDYIRSEPYRRWVVEVDYAAGERPSDNVLGFARNRMTSMVDKPGGMSFQIDDTLSSAEGRTWQDQDLRDLQRDRQDQKTGGDTVVTYMAFVDGRYRESDVLGVTVGYDLIVIFSDRIKDGCRANTFCNNADRAMEIVVTHELGHAIGLVNRGIDMVQPHEDPQHPKHSDNEDSIMYYAAENSDLFDFLAPLGGGLPDDFDTNDRRDVCDAGGKC